MLHLGLDRMWLRYPLAALAGWAVFLVLVRAWAEVERRCFEPGENIDDWLKGHDPAETRQRLKDCDWSVLDWLEVPTDFGDGEGCAVGIALFILALLLLVAFGAVLNVIAAAPLLIAEVFLDAVLVAALMKRVRDPEQRWWLVGAVRHTAGPVAVTVLVLMLAGAVLQALAPRAKSLGEVWRHYHPPELPLLEREDGDARR